MFRKITLENGLRVLTAPMQGTNTVTVLVMCGTGSDYERREENGISHFLEHMFFKGTAARPNAKAIREELDAMGSISNAFTDHETTGYYIKAGKPYAERSLEILADIYKHSIMPAEEIEREKQVVVEELHLRRDTPTIYIGEMWERLLYGDQPAGREVGGSEETIRTLRREGLLEYFGHQYVAANTVVVVAGSIKEDETIARIGTLFSDTRESQPQRTKPPLREAQHTPQLITEEKKTDQTHLLIGFRGYDAFQSGRYAAELLTTVLGGSWSSRMFSRIREELGLAYAVSTDSDYYSNRGAVVTYAGVAHENVAPAVQAILGEYRRIRDEAVGMDELNRTRDFLKGRTLMSLEASNAVASFVGGEEMLTGKPVTVDEVFARIDAVEPSDIQRAATELFRPERLNLAALGPALSSRELQAHLGEFT